MPRYGREFYEAYDAFLLSEQERHYEDISMIIKKRQALHDLGYRCDIAAPWINEEDFEPQEEMPTMDFGYGTFKFNDGEEYEADYEDDEDVS